MADCHLLARGPAAAAPPTSAPSAASAGGANPVDRLVMLPLIPRASSTARQPRYRRSAANDITLKTRVILSEAPVW
jgi:hypothetical protein